MGKKEIAYINHNVLKAARERTPIKIDDIEMICKEISSEELKKWEDGIDLPSITNAKKLANIYDIPFAALYLSELPNNVSPKIVDRRTYKDAIDSEISYEVWKEINKLKSIRENVLEYLNEEEYINELLEIKSTNFKELVEEIRKRFKIETPYKNKSAYANNSFSFFRKKIEEKGILVLQIENLSIKEVRGISINFDILPIIAVNCSDSDRGKTFTLFHELAHLIRRTSNLCLVDFNIGNDKEEKECNNLAAEILIPKHLICEELNSIKEIDDICIERLSDKFAVSKFVIIKKLYDIEKIDKEFYKEKYTEYINEFNKIKEKIVKKDNRGFALPDTLLISRKGKLYSSILLNAYYDGKISFGKLCNTFNIKSKYVSSIERMVMFGGR